MPDVWQALTKAALRLISERRQRATTLDPDEITESALLACGVVDADQYRRRLRAFVSDMLRG